MNINMKSLMAIFTVSTYWV